MDPNLLALLLSGARPTGGSGGTPLPPFLMIKPKGRPEQVVESPIPHTDKGHVPSELGVAESEILRAITQRKPLLDGEGDQIADFSSLPPEVAQAIAELLSKVAPTGTVSAKVAQKAEGPKPLPEPPRPADVRSPNG